VKEGDLLFSVRKYSSLKKSKTFAIDVLTQGSIATPVSLNISLSFFFSLDVSRFFVFYA